MARQPEPTLHSAPQWAVKRMGELLYEAMAPGGDYQLTLQNVFAQYIAAHEPDPVEIEVARLLPDANQHPLEVVIRTALRRGIEIGTPA